MADQVTYMVYKLMRDDWSRPDCGEVSCGTQGKRKSLNEAKLQEMFDFSKQSFLQ